MDHQIKHLKTELFARLDQDYSSAKTHVSAELERTKHQLDQIKAFIDSRYEDIRHMLSENRERMSQFATRDLAIAIEDSLKNRVRKYEEEVDCVQKTIRDTLNKFNDCQARLTKQIEINTMRGSQL